MPTFVKTRVRCALFPSKVAEPFKNVFTNGTPKIYKGAGVDFELALFDSDDALFDVSNITDLTVLVRPSGSDTVEILKTVSAVQVGLTLEQWRNGTVAHATVSLLGSETSIAAGQHRITVWGHTNDAGSDPDVFGTSTIEVVDAGITAVTNPALTPSYLTEDQIRALMAGYIPYVIPAGKTLTFQTPNGLHKRIVGVQTGPDGPVRQDDLEEVI